MQLVRGCYRSSHDQLKSVGWDGTCPGLMVTLNVGFHIFPFTADTPDWTVGSRDKRRLDKLFLEFVLIMSIHALKL